MFSYHVLNVEVTVSFAEILHHIRPAPSSSKVERCAAQLTEGREEGRGREM